MAGYARIIESDESIYIRFESIGNRQRFSLVMDKFNQSFPLKIWDEQCRAWQLTPDNKNALLEFSKRIFGPPGYVLQARE